MTVDFHVITDAPNVADKSLDTAYTKNTVQPYAPCDIITPTLEMEYDSTIFSKNYCKIHEFNNGYYFITDKIVLTGQRIILHCQIDVLKTYLTGIKNSMGVVLRAENPKNRILHDSKFPLSSEMILARSWLYPQTPFSAASGWNYLLTTAGGVNT